MRAPGFGCVSGYRPLEGLEKSNAGNEAGKVGTDNEFPPQLCLGLSSLRWAEIRSQSPFFRLGHLDRFLNPRAHALGLACNRLISGRSRPSL